MTKTNDYLDKSRKCKLCHEENGYTVCMHPMPRKKQQDSYCMYMHTLFLMGRVEVTCPLYSLLYSELKLYSLSCGVYYRSIPAKYMYLVVPIKSRSKIENFSQLMLDL